jgi:hypothetical protein
MNKVDKIKTEWPNWHHHCNTEVWDTVPVEFGGNEHECLAFDKGLWATLNILGRPPMFSEGVNERLLE